MKDDGQDQIEQAFFELWGYITDDVLCGALRRLWLWPA
jgi:hypothetical protein